MYTAKVDMCAAGHNQRKHEFWEVKTLLFKFLIHKYDNVGCFFFFF